MKPSPTPRRRASRSVLPAVLAALLLAAVPAGAAPSSDRTLRGRLVMVHEGPEMHYFLDVGGRMTRELVFPGDPLLRPGAVLEIHGTIRGDTLQVSSFARLPAAVAAPSTTGTRKLLVILVKWGSSTIGTTPAQATDFVFGTTDPQRRSVKQWYEDVSYGQLEWTGDVTSSVLTIADPGACDLYTIANRADTAATNAGYTLANYDNRMYDFPAGYCNSSFGEVGGARSWIEDGLSAADLSDGYARMAPDHELGHNLGEYHGHGLDCGASTITSGCVTGAGGGALECDYGGAPPCVSEYGDSYDVMGNNWTGDPLDGVNWFGIWHEINLGWVDGRTITDAQPATAQDHPFTIAPI